MMIPNGEKMRKARLTKRSCVYIKRLLKQKLADRAWREKQREELKKGRYWDALNFQRAEGSSRHGT